MIVFVSVSPSCDVGADVVSLGSVCLVDSVRRLSFLNALLDFLDFLVDLSSCF